MITVSERARAHFQKQFTLCSFMSWHFLVPFPQFLLSKHVQNFDPTPRSLVHIPLDGYGHHHLQTFVFYLLPTRANEHTFILEASAKGNLRVRF